MYHSSNAAYTQSEHQATFSFSAQHTLVDCRSQNQLKRLHHAVRLFSGLDVVDVVNGSS